MDASNFERYLEERYEDQVKWYSKKSSFYKRYYQWCHSNFDIRSCIGCINIW